jgi:hypothetical protein
MMDFRRRFSLTLGLWVALGFSYSFARRKKSHPRGRRGKKGESHRGTENMGRKK